MTCNIYSIIYFDLGSPASLAPLSTVALTGTSSESYVLLLRLGDGSHVDKRDGSFVVMDKVGCGDGVDGDGVAAAAAAATVAH